MLDFKNYFEERSISLPEINELKSIHNLKTQIKSINDISLLRKHIDKNKMNELKICYRIDRECEKRR